MSLDLAVRTQVAAATDDIVVLRQTHDPVPIVRSALLYSHYADTAFEMAGSASGIGCGDVYLAKQDLPGSKRDSREAIKAIAAQVFSDRLRCSLSRTIARQQNPPTDADAGAVSPLSRSGYRHVAVSISNGRERFQAIHRW